MKNHYEVRGEITAIFLNRKDGSVLETIIDTEDLPIAQSFTGTWYASRLSAKKGSHYVAGNVKNKIKSTSVYLHRWLFGNPKGVMIDHINHDALDNRRSCNLRTVTSSQNHQNRKSYDNKLVGVVFVGEHQRWRASIMAKGKIMYLGYYDTYEKAENVVKQARAKYLPYSAERRELGEIKEIVGLNVCKLTNRSNNISGVKNVHWYNREQKYVVKFMVNRKSITIGHYDDYDEAVRAANEARVRLKKEASL